MADFYRIEDRASAVRSVQGRLRAISQNDGRIPSVFVDGIYGEETERAVRVFQETRGLPVTGAVDSETHEAIAKEYDLLVLEREVILGVPDFDRLAGGVISPGDRFDGVTALQLLLCSIAEQDDRFAVTPDGFYGDETLDAVKFFQALRGKTQDGVVDRVLWNELMLFASRRREE